MRIFRKSLAGPPAFVMENQENARRLSQGPPSPSNSRRDNRFSFYKKALPYLLKRDSGEQHETNLEETLGLLSPSYDDLSETSTTPSTTSMTTHIESRDSCIKQRRHDKQCLTISNTTNESFEENINAQQIVQEKMEKKDEEEEELQCAVYTPDQLYELPPISGVSPICIAMNEDDLCDQVPLLDLTEPVSFGDHREGSRGVMASVATRTSAMMMPGSMKAEMIHSCNTPLLDTTITPIDHPINRIGQRGYDTVQMDQHIDEMDESLNQLYHARLARDIEKLLGGVPN